MTAKSENSRKVSGCVVMCRSCRIVVEGAVAAKERDPGDGADDAGGPERNGAQQEQHRAHRRTAHMEDQEIRNVEAEKERDRPHDEGELQRADIDPQRCRRGQQLTVVVEHEGRIDADAVVIEEAHDQEQHGRQREQHEQDERERADLEPGGEPWCHRPGRRPICAEPPLQEGVDGGPSSAMTRRCAHAACLTSLAAAHQWHDAGAELLHADHEVIERQHHALHAGHCRTVRPACAQPSVGADQHALVGRQFVDAQSVRRCVPASTGPVFGSSSACASR